MNLQTDLQAAVDSAEANAAKLDAYVHGPAAGDDSLVAVDSGPLKTLARQLAEHNAAVANGVIGPAPWATPVAFANGIVCTAATATTPATAFTYLGETYVCVIGHTTSGGAPDLAKVIKITQKGTNGTNGTSGLVWPGGRLTLSAGQAAMTNDVAASATLRYTPHIHARVPIYDGSTMLATAFAEISNNLTQSATGKAGPAAAGPYQCIDAFVWNDAGTVRLTRGPRWRQSAAVTTTIASPAVLNWVGHPLFDGATYRFEATTGALPTGFALNTDYFVTRVSADTFRLSTTLANQVAGTFIATSGAQSGVHTGANYTTGRGTGAGTSELERVDGIWVNKFDVTNGPAARMGTYVGTIYTNASSQVDFKMGSTTAGGGEAIIGIWNAYNRITVSGTVADTTDSWNYTTATFRPPNASANIRATFVQGFSEDVFEGEYRAGAQNSGGGNSYAAGVGFNSTSSPSGGWNYVSSPAAGYAAIVGGATSGRGLGLNFLTALEFSQAAGTTTFYGDNGAASSQTSFRYRGRY